MLPDGYSAPQAIAPALRQAGSNALIWDSVHRSAGQCVGIFWPDLIAVPIQSRHYCYHCNCSAVDFVRQYNTGVVLQVTR